MKKMSSKVRKQILAARKRRGAGEDEEDWGCVGSSHTVGGRVMPSSSNYSGDSRVPGNLDGRNKGSVK